MTGGSYRRVAQRENSNLSTSSSSDSLEYANITRSRGERMGDKLVAFGWIIVCLLVTRWTSFYSTLWNSHALNRNLLRLAFLGLTLIVALALYLTVYLPRVKGLMDSSAWNVYCPKVVPSMIGLSVVTLFVFLRAIWPVWGFLAPLIFGTQFMGIVMSLHFVPMCW